MYGHTCIKRLSLQGPDFLPLGWGGGGGVDIYLHPPHLITINLPAAASQRNPRDSVPPDCTQPKVDLGWIAASRAGRAGRAGGRAGGLGADLERTWGGCSSREASVKQKSPSNLPQGGAMCENFRGPLRPSGRRQADDCFRAASGMPPPLRAHCKAHLKTHLARPEAGGTARWAGGWRAHELWSSRRLNVASASEWEARPGIVFLAALARSQGVSREAGAGCAGQAQADLRRIPASRLLPGLPPRPCSSREAFVGLRSACAWSTRAAPASRGTA